MAVNRVKRQAYESMSGQWQQSQPRERKAGWSAAANPKKKKIDRTVGDYVAYEDLAGGTPPPSSDRTRTTATEQQIVDAEWEDLP